MSDLFINGLSEVELENLDGALGAVTDKSKRKAILKTSVAALAAKKAVPGRGTSRDEFQKQINRLSPDIASALERGNKSLRDVVLYVTKNVAGQKNIKMFRDDDNKVPGISNISAGKLEKDQVMMLDSIVVLSGTGASNDNPYDVAFGLIPAALRNGEFYFKANDTEIIPLSSLEVFNTDGMVCRKGIYRLDNPVLLNTQKAMEFYAEWGSAAADKTWMRLILMGSRVNNS